MPARSDTALDFGKLLQQFAHDDKVKWVLVLVVVDLVFGVIDAVVRGTFRFSYIGAFLRHDVLGKVVPWFVLYAAGKVTTEDLPGGVSFAALADGAFGIIVLALAGSLLNSLRSLGLQASAGDAKKKGLEVVGAGVPAEVAAPQPAPTPGRHRLQTALFGSEHTI